MKKATSSHFQARLLPQKNAVRAAADVDRPSSQPCLTSATSRVTSAAMPPAATILARMAAFKAMFANAVMASCRPRGFGPFVTSATSGGMSLSSTIVARPSLIQKPRRPRATVALAASPALPVNATKLSASTCFFLKYDAASAMETELMDMRLPSRGSWHAALVRADGQEVYFLC